MCLYPLVAFIFTQILFSYSDSEAAFQWFVFLLFVITIISIVVTASEKRSFKPFFNILNQIFFLIVVYMPMIIIYYLRRHSAVFEYYRYSYDYESPSATTIAQVKGQSVYIYDYRHYLDQYLYTYWQEQYDIWFLICKISPIIVFFICLPLMKKLFVKQLALPRRT